MKQKLTELKEEIDNSTVLVGGFIPPPSVINTKSRLKKIKTIEKI